ncbi:Far upstream element-binding protein [Thalictrum thalictroides]|uniref:Far upstream element-binding protein n=1 Tax=Thalictrum thalictroides TaxID=46969 RepID=A0A7J6UXY2_THATH|nr:Far upstream element-binding protein [Thalictrum thalictroides]
MAEEEVAIAAASVEENETKTSPVTTDLKRKLDDLEPKEEEDQLQEETVVKSSNDELNLNSGEVEENSVPDAKKPRLEEESDGSALENGHGVPKPDSPSVDKAGVTTTNVEPENNQDTNSENVDTENLPVISAADVDAADVSHVKVENTETENADDRSAKDILEGDAEKSYDETLKSEDDQHPSGGDLQDPTAATPQQGDLTSSQAESLIESQSVSRKMEVPNNKVGVLIGKSGDTIRFLQLNSGAKIQITRDAEADRYSATRPVELIGTLENINKAEKLIKDVIAEADAGGSPSLVARGFGTVQASGAAEQIEIQVPNEKVGLIIGKGGETIKNLQTRSGARIQLIPQHLPEGDQSKERTVRVTGDKRQIEVARDMIREVMNQIWLLPFTWGQHWFHGVALKRGDPCFLYLLSFPVRPSPLSGGYNQQPYRPRGPSGPPQWGHRAPHSAPSTGYDNQHRGMYSSQNPHYMPPSYGGYPPQQSAPRSNFNAGWDQRSGPMQTPPPQGGGYDYYAHGGHVADSSAPTPISNSGPVPASGHGAPHGSYNNYGQPTYSQAAPSQQSYGHGYDDPKYANQAQAAYGGHGNAQPSPYPQQVATQPGYAQQQYSKPQTYGMPSQGSVPQSYGPPRGGQPGDVPYQNPISSAHSYGQTVPSQQPYPYASSGPTQTYPYTSAPAANDGYNQPPAHSAPASVYPQAGGQPVSGYGQPGGQPAPGYVQGGQSGGYGPYASQPQPSYGEQPVPNNASYGYQGPADAGYANAPTSAYGAPPNAQTNYVQPTANQASYEQPAPQSSGYASAPGSAPGYVKTLSPQPVYGQYDSTQMYGGQH